MTDQTADTKVTLGLPRTLPGGEVVAVDVGRDAFLNQFLPGRYEWVEGVVIRMSPIRYDHDKLVSYLRRLAEAYFALRPMGEVVGDPFIMRLPTVQRAPDLQLLIGDSRNRIHETYLDGPADICVEVVSPGSVAVDYGEKLAEYEAGGVQEYWIIDSMRRRTQFNRLTNGVYEDVQPVNGVYVTPLLPKFEINTTTLWQDPLPNYGEVWAAVQGMLEDT